ncbi:hypothetical protein [Spirosoma utsteinense]|uniref:PNPLA domain-containing protein n=1 Tax=Spirosoma utsteinense TaxID=2585773 RepID=A0ABR6WC57_9BACT|nr:hypothetical protein [Spirosoma utsteinense]MBC3783881.1 hypothetical protein [Spirosoma utsteinense]MBC3793540.1 hypothetical protein [Spirosoma utsteinense]
MQSSTPPTFSQQARNYIIAFYQTQRNAFVVIITLLIGFYVLNVPDQAEDMIQAVIDTGITSRLFLYIMLSVFVWSCVVYCCTRMILHISPVGLRLNDAADWLLRWLPKFGGILPTLILTFAFWQPAHLHSYLLLLESGLMLALFLWVERRVPVFRLPRNWNFSNRYTSFKQDIRELWRHPLGRLTLKSGFVLTGFLLLLFSLPVEWEIARRLRPTAVVIFGISLLTFWGSLIVYFNDYRYRPLVLIVGAYLIVISAWNDNTAVRRAINGVPPIRDRPTVEEHFARWVKNRRQEDRDTIPLVLIAAEGGGTRALNWTAETLIRLDSIIPGFSRHVYALSGVSGGGVGTVFYTAFLRDIPQQQRISHFDRFRNIIRDDYLSGVSAALLFPESIQRVLPVAVPALERGKWLEDSWADSYRDNLALPTLDQSLTQLYQTPAGYNYDLPSLLLNGTLAESGQKTITSNLKLNPRYFNDVVSTIDVLGADVPLKTAASLCSRFPVVTNGGLIQKDTVDQRGRKRPYGGHVVDGGYFDNSGVETCIQLLNNLVPSIRRLDTTERVTIIPYIIFIQNSNTVGQLSRKRSMLQVLRIPLLGFFNAWDNGSVTRDNMFNSFMDRFTNPKTNYLTLRLAYNANYPLGWFLSDSVARVLSQQAQDSISLRNRELVRLKNAFVRTRPVR